MNSLAFGRIRVVFLAVCSPFLLPSSLFPQGNLTPPGAPAPTMKTLTEVEPRIAVQTLTGDATSQFLISQPGSYYLSGNINGVSGKSAVAINADNVTLDLDGYALIGVAGATNGVEIRGTRNQVIVQNGTVRGFSAGGVIATGTMTNARFDSLSIHNISAGRGISIPTGEGSQVRDCGVTLVGGGGIVLSSNSGQVENCVVNGCTSAVSIDGIVAATVTGCSVFSVSSSTSSSAQPVTGINAQTVRSCTVITIASSGSRATGILASTANASTISSVNGNVASIGINAQSVSSCHVFQIGSNAGVSGQASGIFGGSAVNCNVSNIGGINTSGVAIGINCRTIDACRVIFVGTSFSNVGATGLLADNVSACSVSNIFGGSIGNVTGINANVVSGSNVETLGQGASSGSLNGIAASVVTGSRVSGAAGNTSGLVSGITSASTVRSCEISSISNNGSGASAGLTKPTSSTAGLVENTVFRSTGNFGVSTNSHQRIVGCTFSSMITGIVATGTHNVIEGNQVDTCTVGINVTSGTNTAQALVIRNQVRNCAVNITTDAPCQVGPIVTATGFISSTNPWDNFTD